MAHSTHNSVLASSVSALWGALRCPVQWLKSCLKSSLKSTKNEHGSFNAGGSRWRKPTRGRQQSMCYQQRRTVEYALSISVGLFMERSFLWTQILPLCRHTTWPGRQQNLCDSVFMNEGKPQISAPVAQTVALRVSNAKSYVNKSKTLL